MKRVILTLFPAVLVLATACQKPADNVDAAADSTAVKAPVPVETAVIAASNVKRLVSAAGTVKGIREVTVVTETGGTVTDVMFGLGRYVEKDAVLFTIDSDIQKTALEQAERGLETAEMSLAVTEKLHAEGSASDMELVAAKAAAAGAKTGVESARKALERCSVTSPIAGRVAFRDPGIETGNSVGMGMPAAKIVALHTLMTTVNVGEMEIGLVKRGLSTLITIPALGNKVFKGAVSAVGAGADAATGSYPVEVTWANTRAREIKSGMSCRVDIVTRSDEKVILVPNHAVILKDGRDAVYEVKGNKSFLRFITTGRVDGDEVVVKKGLEPGVELITTGMTALAQGDSVLTGGGETVE